MRDKNGELVQIGDMVIIDGIAPIGKITEFVSKYARIEFTCTAMTLLKMSHEFSKLSMEEHFLYVLEQIS